MTETKVRASPNETRTSSFWGTEATRARYDRIARFYNLLDYPTECLLYARRRRRLWERVLPGKGLEVGVGTGKNLPYYPAGADVTAIDLSPRMPERASRLASNLGLKVDWALADAEHLDFPDDSFDWVVGTFVFCSVPDPVRGLRELMRACRADGHSFLLEHMRAEWPLVGRLMDFLNPVFMRATGANINRCTLDYVRESGFLIESVEDLTPAGVFRFMTLRPAQ